MFRSIFTRLFWTNFFIMVIALVMMSATMTGFLSYYIENKQYDISVKTAKNIEYITIVLQIENHDLRSQRVYNSTLSSWSEFTGSDITVVDSRGDVFASTTGIVRVPGNLLSRVLSGETIKIKNYFGNYYQKPVFVVGIPMYYQDNIAGAIFFNTLVPDLNRNITDFMYMLGLSCAAAMLLAFVLVYIQSKHISMPIKDINKAVNYIASGKFDKRVKVSAPDEIGQLASSFNYMAETLSKTNDMQNEFISDVSHELRTPMTSISGFVEGILDGTISPEKEKDYLKLVYDESVRLTKLTNDMLEMSKMSSSEYKLSVSEFDINELVRRCIIQLEQRISGKNLELEVNFDAEIIKVLGDKDAIQRVIINILDNAVKFSFENTKIMISTWYKDSKAYVSIGNFGIGMSSDEIKHIFDRFYKTDKSRTSDKKGAGLGLSMVKNIMSLHKQQIWVDSTETKSGTGVKFTKFTFTLQSA